MTKTGTWDELGIMPGRLSKLIVLGKAKVVGKDQANRKIYELLDETDDKEVQDERPA